MAHRLPAESWIEPFMDAVEGQNYRWLIGDREARRISQLLEYDIRKTGFLGFNMNSLPKTCPRCGKQTEVADWWVRALLRIVLSTGSYRRQVLHCPRPWDPLEGMDHQGIA